MGQAEASFLKAVSLDDKYALDQTRAYMTGVEALVRLPMLQHQRDAARGLNTAGFVSGYRGSPLGGVDQAMWKAQSFLERHHIHFQPGINEELAATAVWGSQQTTLFPEARYDGVFGMWYGKGPGVDRSMDVFKHANAFGTSRHGGVLAVAGDDHACKSSTLPHQSEHMFMGASIPVLAPADVQEVLDLGIFGWELSRYCGCWVGLKAITENMDSAISADIDPSRVSILIPEDFQLPAEGVHARWPDQPLEQERRLNKFKIYAAREFARVNGLNHVVIDSPNPRLGIVTSGKAYLDVMQALEDMGIDQELAAAIGIRVFKVGMPWPLEPEGIHQFAEGLEEVLVVEEKRSVIEDQLTSQLYNYPVAARPIVVGEFDERGADLVPNTGELTPAMVALAIASRLRRFFTSADLESRIAWIEQKERALTANQSPAARAPHFCSGCPHNTSTKVPDGSHAMGGIGCHYMATWMPDRNTHTFAQMGGEGVTWLGQAPFTKTQHVFQNLGDGTYFHSGILAIRAAIAAGVNITYKILLNEAVAMTGGQPLDGQLTVKNLIQQLRGEGVHRIALVSDQPQHHRGQFEQIQGLTLDHRDDLDAVQRALREVEGCSVIIYQQPCAAEKRRKLKRLPQKEAARRIVINDEVCEGCGDCGVQSNCLSIMPKETALGRKRQINQSACNLDYSCVKGFCPSFVSVIDAKLKKSPPADSTQVLFPPLPPTETPKLSQPWNMVVSGVGGTGVLTVTALVAMAAHIEGKGCATLNQTGLAQKFGAVVSHARVAPQQTDIKAVRVPAGEADLLIGCDLVVSASYETMGKTAEGRTYAIINDAEQPTADFIHDPDAQLPTTALRAHILEQCSNDQVTFVDASLVASRLLGDSIYANLFLLGIAHQLGKVPVSAEALNAAIALNGVEIEANQKAFIMGCRFAVWPEKVLALLEPSDQSLHKNEPAETIGLDELIDDRARRLVAYQSESLAKSYRHRVETIRQQDPQASHSESITHVVAKQLYRLMAIKDEYEVARLFTSDGFRAQLEAQFEPGYRLQFHLAPPILSRIDHLTGRIRKRALGGWMMIVFRLLAALRRLRNTPLDLFALTAERRSARSDLDHYLDDLDLIRGHLNTQCKGDAHHLAQLPEKLRGYGVVREKARAALQPERDALRQKLASGDTAAPVIRLRPADHAQP